MDKVIVFIDGACEPKNPRGVPTYGFLIYGDEKKIDEESGLGLADPWTEQATNNVAEYTALIKALEKLLNLGLQDSEVEVRSDSELLVKQVNGVYKVRNPRLRPLYERVNGLLPRFKNIQMKWIQREENAEADDLSKRAYESYIRASPKQAVEKGVIFCSQCGAKIPMDSKFCKECGRKLV